MELVVMCLIKQQWFFWGWVSYVCHTVQHKQQSTNKIYYIY
jgi:hypothetical protein